MTEGIDPLVGRTLAARFEILDRIGEGGSGVVYRAKQLSVDRVVALKVLSAHVSTDPTWVRRFHNEARAASRLNHPNTVRLIDFGQTAEGLLFIAMEYLSGRSLRTEIDRLGRLPIDRVLRLLAQLCSSMAEAHQQGIIHRDIKPDNVYLVDVNGSDDFVKVLDFSLAKLDSPDGQVTHAGVVFGTPRYMSPEQARGLPLDARSDIYAVGLLAYELLTGQPPFVAAVPTDVVMMHLSLRPAPLLDVPAPVNQLVQKALEKSPEQRQQSAQQLERECQEVLSQLDGRVAPPLGSWNAARTVLATDAGAFAAPVALAEQKTVIGQEVPSLPPPPAAPPPAFTATPAQRTMMAAAPEARTVMAAAPEVRTVMAAAPATPTAMAAAPAPTRAAKTGGETELLPDSAGVVAYARDRAQRARQAAFDELMAPPGPGVLFWFAWLLLGVGVGLGIHFFWPPR